MWRASKADTGDAGQGFGSLVFVRAAGSGVIYLRVLPTMVDAVHAELQRVLDTYSEEHLLRSFTVIDAHGHRIRNLPVRPVA